MDEGERRRGLGRAIRQARVWRGLTQAQLAAAVGVAPRTIARWEHGQDTPPMTALGPLCEALGVSGEYFRPPHDERLLLG